MKFYQRCAIALALVVCMVFLSACDLPSVVMQLMATATPVATATPTPEPTPMPTEEVIPEYTAGTIEGYEYRSEFFRFGCNLDEKWTIATPEELAQQHDYIVQTMNRVKAPNYLSEPYQDPTVNYEFIALANRGLQSIAIGVEDATNVLADEDSLDMDTVLRLQKIPLLYRLEQLGMEIYSSDNVNVFIGEKRQTAVFIDGESDGVSTYILIILMQRGKYLVSINITTLGSDITNEILEKFYMIQ